MHVSIESATADDRSAILRLLSNNALPLDGLLDHMDTVIVARAEGRVVGCAALEVYPDGALLRSVAVEATARGQGVGTRLTTSALELASARDIRAVYLLTTTAEGFFATFAFRRIERWQVPPTVRTSIEFRSACPSIAIVMSKVLTAPRSGETLG